MSLPIQIRYLGQVMRTRSSERAHDDCGNIIQTSTFKLLTIILKRSFHRSEEVSLLQLFWVSNVCCTVRISMLLFISRFSYPSDVKNPVRRWSWRYQERPLHYPMPVVQRDPWPQQQQRSPRNTHTQRCQTPPRSQWKTTSSSSMKINRVLKGLRRILYIAKADWHGNCLNASLVR